MFGTVANGLRSLRNGWSAFWYEQDDPIGICIIRIVVGTIFLYSLLIWSIDVQSFFSQSAGWQPDSLVAQLQKDQFIVSFWHFVPDEWIIPVHWVCVLVAACFAMGLWTNVTKFLVLAISISYANRVPMAQFGLDQLTNVWLLYLCFGPCGQRLSVDRWLNLRSARTSGRDPKEVTPSSAARFSQRLIQVHLCFVYFWAGVSKLRGDAWSSGEALWMIASNYEHQQVSLTWLAYVPWLYQALSVGTWIWEISFPLAIWNRNLRTPVIAIGIAMHLGIGLFLGLWPFSLIMMASYVSFVPAAVLLRLVGLQVGDKTEIAQVPHEERALPIKDESEAESLETKHAPSVVKPIVAQDASSTQITTETPRKKPELRSNPTKVSSEPSGYLKRFPKKVPIMFADSDQDNLVVYVERSTKRRCSMIRALEEEGFRCIGLDAWPELIEVYNALRPKSVLCNAHKMPASELRFWRAQLNEREDSNFIVLIEPHHIKHVNSGDSNTIAIPIPASLREICRALNGGDDDANDPRQKAFGSRKSNDDSGDQIFSMTS